MIEKHNIVTFNDETTDKMLLPRVDETLII